MNSSISKEELNALPVEVYDGEIVVVDSPEGVARAAEVLRAAPLIGFDTETKPAFRKGQLNNVALLQLATPEVAFLIRLCVIGLPAEIKVILEDENICKVGLSIKDDFHSLARIGTLNPAGFIDLQEYVRRFGITDSSLTKIHGLVFGRRISKSQQLSNWEAPVLTPAQQRYAALDARACISIISALPHESPE